MIDVAVPCGKIVDGESFSIVTDYLGTPEYMYNAKGELVWHGILDIYGRISINKGDKYDCPFRYLGQYADRETGGLYYNRFRYYDSNTGLYISQDPIGLAGGMVLYGYVGDVNIGVDQLGLEVYDIVAATDGFYPVYKKGQLNPSGYVKLKEGDLYKIGESQNASKRYRKSKLKQGRINKSKAKSYAIDENGKIKFDSKGKPIHAGLEVKVDPSTIGNTKDADRLIETNKIKAYEQQNKKLPPGNKTHH